jgi:hypothetical protein
VHEDSLVLSLGCREWAIRVALSHSEYDRKAKRLLLRRKVMVTVSLVLMVAAFILFILAALNVPSPPRFNLIAAGLAMWLLSVLINNVH